MGPIPMFSYINIALTMTINTYSGCVKTLLCSFVILCSFTRGFGQYEDSLPRGSVYDLTKLNVYRETSDSNSFIYQARCTIPCSGTYRPDTLYITVNADRVFSPQFEAYGNFEASQLVSSNIWWIKNTNWLTANDGQCQFDFQFTYTSRYPEPEGTCQMGWNMTTECLIPDNNPYCENLESNPTLCYDQSIYHRCCHACSSIDESSPDDDIYCPYGNRDDTMCKGLPQADCYTMNYTCCGTCKTYEESIPGCRYGNRDANVCDFIVHADCYNTTLERDCCYECHYLADRNRPDCMYGDKAAWCYDISSSDCYQRETELTCCQTCGGYSSDVVPNCEYGDINDCSDVQRDECKTDQNVRNDCCETCYYLEDNNCNEDKASCPSNLQPSDCYNPNTRRSCCRTCLSYYDVSQGENCTFGDRDGDCWFDVHAHHCYDTIVQEQCCETCSFYTIETYYSDDPDLEDCLYGDRQPNLCFNITGNMCYNRDVAIDCCLQCSYFTLDHLPQTCLYGNKDPCTDLAASECYQPTFEDRCCETCHSYNRTDLGYDCRYGDKIDSCYTRPISSCYDDNSRSTCCQYCSTHENTNDPECPYGDKLQVCTTNLTPSMCYQYESECCQSCPRMVKGHLDQDTCKYGDRRNCSGILASQCYNANVEYDCCETCFYLRNQTNNGCDFGDSSDCSNLAPWQCYDRADECCASCEYYIQPELVAENCMYGDRTGSCANINSYQCYEANTAYKCCETCSGYRRDDLPDSCEYGDKSSVCVTGDGHGSSCYNATILDICCAACQTVQTTDPDCLYGDKATYCQDIEPRNCYQSNTERTCCQTCPTFYEPNYPQGCEYGDIYSNCQVSSCARYSTQRLQECCYTCRAYLSTTSPTTSSTTTTNPTPTGTEESKGGGHDGTTAETRPFDTTTETQSTSRVSTTTAQSATPRHNTRPWSTRTPFWTDVTTRLGRTTRLPFWTDVTTRMGRTTRLPFWTDVTTRMGRTTRLPFWTDVTTRMGRTTRLPFWTSTTRDVFRSTGTPFWTTTITTNEISSTASPSDVMKSTKTIFDSTAAIVGGLIGGIVVIIIIVAVAFYCIRVRNRTPKPDYDKTDFDPLDSHRQNQLTGPTGASVQYNPNGHMAFNPARPNHSFSPNTTLLNNQPPMKAPPRRQESEEVYDYINPDDVKTVVSMPITRRPTLPDRKEENVYEPYLEPAKNGDADEKTGYDNLGLAPVEHQYYVLESEPDQRL